MTQASVSEPKRRTHSIDEAAEILGISRSSAYEAAKAGSLPTIRIGRRLLVPTSALDRLLAVGGVAA
jgi:excisionase family DNA binding protein